MILIGHGLCDLTRVQKATPYALESVADFQELQSSMMLETALAVRRRHVPGFAQQSAQC